MLLISSTVSMCFVCLFYSCIRLNRYEDTIKKYQKNLAELEDEVRNLREEINTLKESEGRK